MTRHTDTNSKHRYFYTDDLASAWMAKHFGMRFEVQTHTGLLEVPIEYGWSGPFYIHPDSLPLLEPRAGDLLQGAVVLDRPGLRIVDSNDHEDLEDAKTLMFRGMKIIQRNSIPFHWPKSEAA